MGKRWHAAVVSACMWWVIGCGVNRAPIAGLSAEGGSSAGNGGESGSASNGGDSGSGAVGGEGGGVAGGNGGSSGSAGTSGAGGAGGAGGLGGVGGGGTTDAGIDAALSDAASADSGTDSSVPTLPGSCRNTPASGGACPAGCTCPDEFTCEISCTGIGGGLCGAGEITCPPGRVCKVTCSGIATCANKTIRCADGPCSLDCGGINSCNNTTAFVCGADACSAMCVGLMGGVDVQDNANACDLNTNCL